MQPKELIIVLRVRLREFRQYLANRSNTLLEDNGDKSTVLFIILRVYLFLQKLPPNPLFFQNLRKHYVVCGDDHYLELW